MHGLAVILAYFLVYKIILFTRYNPVQCPFCNKGHRDNYNLKQHVCPVLNMKYGVFEKKELEAGGSMGSSIGVSNVVGSGSSQEMLLKNALALATSKNSDS